MKSKLLHIFVALTLIASLFGVALPAVAGVTPTQTPPPGILFSEEPFLVMVDMWISPVEANVGEMVTISANVSNFAPADWYWIDLYIDGNKEETKVIDIEEDASQIVTFTTIKNIAGTYNATIRERSATFTVKGSAISVVPPPVPPPAKTVNWMLIGGIIAAVVIIVGGTIWRVTHRPRAYSLTNTGAP